MTRITHGTDARCPDVKSGQAQHCPGHTLELLSADEVKDILISKGMMISETNLPPLQEWIVSAILFLLMRMPR